MKKKGFTLIELLGVLVLLAVIALIAFLVIDRNVKSGKEKMYQKQIETIELAAKNWGSDNLDKLPDNNGVDKVMDLLILKMNGYTDVNISNPKTGECFSNDVQIIITNNNGNISYKVDPDSITFNKCDITVYDSEAPNISKISDVVIGGYKSENELTKDTAEIIIETNMLGLDKSDINLSYPIGKPVESGNIEVDYDSATTVNNNGNYENKLNIKLTSPYVQNESYDITVNINEGALENTKGKSNAVTGMIIVDVTPPEVEVLNDKAICLDDSGCSTFIVAGGYYEQNKSSFHFCMDPKDADGNILDGKVVNRYYLLNNELPHKSVYEYKIKLTDNASGVKGEVERYYQEVANNIYHTDPICDKLDNCTFTSYQNQYNDCVIPQPIKNITADTNLHNLFIDKEYDNHIASGASFYGAIVARTNGTKFNSIVEAVYNSDHYYSDLVQDVDIVSLMKEEIAGVFSGYTANDTKTDKLQYLYNSAVETAKNYSKNNISNYISDSYTLYIFGSDQAGNINYITKEFSVEADLSSTVVGVVLEHVQADSLLFTTMIESHYAKNPSDLLSADCLVGKCLDKSITSEHIISRKDYKKEELPSLELLLDEARKQAKACTDVNCYNDKHTIDSANDVYALHIYSVANDGKTLENEYYYIDISLKYPEACLESATPVSVGVFFEVQKAPAPNFFAYNDSLSYDYYSKCIENLNADCFINKVLKGYVGSNGLVNIYSPDINDDKLKEEAKNKIYTVHDSIAECNQTYDYQISKFTIMSDGCINTEQIGYVSSLSGGSCDHYIPPIEEEEEEEEEGGGGNLDYYIPTKVIVNVGSGDIVHWGDDIYEDYEAGQISHNQLYTVMLCPKGNCEGIGMHPSDVFDYVQTSSEW